MKKQKKKALTALIFLAPLLTVSIAKYHFSTGTERNTLRAIVGEDQETTFGQRIQKRLTAEGYTPAGKYAGKLHFKIPLSKIVQGNDEKKSITRILASKLRSAGAEVNLGWSEETSSGIVDVHAGAKTLSCLDEIHERMKEGKWMQAIETGEWPEKCEADRPEDRQWWIRLLVNHEVNPFDILIMAGVLLSIIASIWTGVMTAEKLYRERIIASISTGDMTAEKLYRERNRQPRKER